MEIVLGWFELGGWATVDWGLMACGQVVVGWMGWRRRGGTKRGGEDEVGGAGDERTPLLGG